ncbi:MAG TPA: DUF559 domain-containing protein [Beijerinckiaceae bacterium]|nr:DUF559 domain-containing protein [Beijerinckiaceae bacterium]
MLDGGHHGHDTVAEKDRLRTSDLEQRGYLVLRFWNHDVTSNLDGVCETILYHLRGCA